MHSKIKKRIFGEAFGSVTLFSDWNVARAYHRRGAIHAYYVQILSVCRYKKTETSNHGPRLYQLMWDVHT